MLHTILKESTKGFWEDLGQDLFKKAVGTLVTEVVRSHVDIWKQMHLKKKRRDIDIVWREEDDAYKERKEAEKKKRQEEEEEAKRAKEEKKKPQPPTPEDHQHTPPQRDEEEAPRPAADTSPAPAEPAPAEEDPVKGDEEADGTLDHLSCFTLH